jgi:aspartate/methionine/tyrosine aminotransferase
VHYDAERMFSERTRFELRPNRLARSLAERRSGGRPFIDLTESNPTRAGLAGPAELLAPLADAAALRYDPLPFGLAEARAAVAHDFAGRGYPLEPERIVLHASTSEAYGFLFKLLCDPGDEVLVPRPGYPLFDFLAGLESVRVTSYALAWDGEWHLDVAAVATALGPRTRAIVAVSPGNPTGAYLKRDELSGLEALCAERGLALVSDEVFADYPLREDERRAASVARDATALAFALGGLSKSCGLPQLKLAWTAVTGPEPLQREALARLEVVADTYLSVSTPVQVAALELLARREELQRPISTRLRANLGTLRAAVGPGCPATLLDPEGGWSAVLRVPATLSEEERVTRLLGERDVLVHPGFFFDFPHEAFLVLSLLPPEGDFAEGVARLVADLVL